MKRTNNLVIISAAVMLLATAACTTDNLQTDGDFISLNISSKSMETKATQDGVDDLNENVINTVYYFFYKEGETTAEPVIKGSLVGLGQKGTSTRTEEIPVTSGIAGTLFDGTEKCQTFIVANPPKSMESALGGTPTLEELRALTFETTLKDKQESFTMVFDATANKSSSSGNIMTVEADMQRIANKLTFAINTSKSCSDAGSTWTSDPDKAKVSFYNAFKETNLSGDFEAVKKADDEYSNKYFDFDAILFAGKTEKDTDTWNNKAEKPVYSYPQKWDFVGSKEPYVLIELPWTTSDAASPVTYYYKIFLDVKELKMNTWCHLTININELGSTTADDPKQLFSGMEYMVLNWNDAFASSDGITADVDDARYLMLNQKNYTIYNQEEWDIPFTSSHPCKITDPKIYQWDYSLVKAEFEPHDPTPLDSLSIEINGSLIKFRHELHNDINKTKPDELGIINGAYDVAPYTITFTIMHEDETPGYSENVTVMQYPAIYIVAQPNSCGVDVLTGNDFIKSTTFINIGNASGKTDFTFVDTDYGGDPSETYGDPDMTFGNKNGNMYVVTTTTAPDLCIDDAKTQQYMLGDPRSTKAFADWDNFLKINRLGESLTVDNVNSDDGYRPSYYYPTDESERTATIIAPKIRIASSWGMTSAVTFENAKYRCAAYQEDGYPAGRWRIPTAAELLYICKLSEHHMIPMLYGQATDDYPAQYWCSTGFVEVYRSYGDDYKTRRNPNGTTKYHEMEASQGTYRYLIAEINGQQYFSDYFDKETTKFSVRCVYDEWYWENINDSTPFKTENGRIPKGTTTINGVTYDNYDIRIWGDRQR